MPEDQLPEPTAVVEDVPDEPQAPETPPAAPEPDGTEPATEPQAPEPEADKQVPLAALLDERRSRQSLEAQLAESEARYGRLDERLTVINEKMAPPAASQEDDPVAWLGDQQKALADQVAKTNETVVQIGQQLQGNQLQQNVASLENQFRAEHPDYQEAVAHVFDTIGHHLTALGMGDAQRVDGINRYASWITATSMQQGRNPAQSLYDMAKATGFAAPAEGPVASPEDAKLAMVARGVAASKTLSTAGTRPPKQLTLAGLGDMDDDEFGKATEGDSWEKMWGGT